MIFSLDDFYEDCPRYDLLFALKNLVPELKVNMFTILGRCSPRWIKKNKKIDWIDMVPHGWGHVSEECLFWTKEDTFKYLDKIEPFGLTKGFKAPGYRISNEAYLALLERDYWVADIVRNNDKRPTDLRVFINASPFTIQGHMGHLPDGLEEKFKYYASLRGEFLFIKDLDLRHENIDHI